MIIQKEHKHNRTKLAAKKTAQQQADAQGAKYQTDLAKAQGKTVGTQPGAQQAPAGQNTDPITQATNKGGTQNPARHVKRQVVK